MPVTQFFSSFIWDNLNDTWATLNDNWAGNFDTFVTVEIGDPAVDITNSVFNVSLSRGRNRDLQRTNAGQVAVQLRNETRLFDPQANSPLDSLLKPRVPIVVKTDGAEAFTGVINDWDYTYNVDGQSVASISGSDAFVFFAQESAIGSAIAESSSDRIERVLDDLPNPFPSGLRQLDAGNSTLHAQDYEENALTYLQTIEESEGGLIYMTKLGEFAFQQRELQPATEAVIFADDGVNIPYESIEITFGTDLLANRIFVESIEGVAQAIDSTSQTENGAAELRISSILASASLQGLADSLLFRFGTPEYRLAAVTVNILGLNTQQRAQVLDLEIGSQADVFFTPNRIGDPITLRNRIGGISHDISLESHLVTFNFEALGFALFILDDDPAGKLDNTDFVLGF
jgi:hypothetical protein